MASTVRSRCARGLVEAVVVARGPSDAAQGRQVGTGAAGEAGLRHHAPSEAEGDPGTLRETDGPPGAGWDSTLPVRHTVTPDRWGPVGLPGCSRGLCPTKSRYVAPGL